MHVPHRDCGWVGGRVDDQKLRNNGEVDEDRWVILRYRRIVLDHANRGVAHRESDRQCGVLVGHKDLEDVRLCCVGNV